MALDRLEKINLLKVLRSTKTTDFYLNDILAVVKQRKGINEEIFKFLIENSTEKINNKTITIKFLEKSIKLINTFLHYALFEEHMPIDEDLLALLDNFTEVYSTYLDGVSKKLTPELKGTIKNFELHIDNIKKAYAVALEKCAQKESELEQQEGDIFETTEVEEIDTKDEEIDTKDEELQKLESLLKDKEKDLTKKDKIIGGLKDDKAKMNEELTALRAEVGQLQKEKISLEKDANANKKALEDLNKQIEQTVQRKDELFEKYEKTHEELKEKKATLADIQQQETAIANEEKERLKIEHTILECLCKNKMTLEEITKYLLSKKHNVTERDVYKIIQKINERINVTRRDFALPPQYMVGKPEFVTNGVFDFSDFYSDKSCDLLFISDIHFEEASEEVKKAYDAVYNYATGKNIKVVFNTGDLFGSSLAMQTGVSPERITTSLNIIESFADNVPYDKNVYQAVLGGNHDKKIFSYGLEPLSLLQKMREDIIPLGYDHCQVIVGGAKSILGLHHPQRRFPETIAETGYNVASLVNYISTYCGNQKIARDANYVNFLGHLHRSMMDLDNSLVLVPSLLRDRYFNGAWHIKIYFDGKRNIDSMVFIPLILEQDKLLATSEIPYRKSLKK